MNQSKYAFRMLLTLLLASLLAACGSRMKAGAVRSSNYQAYARYDKWWVPIPSGRHMTLASGEVITTRVTHVLTERPATEFVVVGTVEVRTSRPAAMSELIEAVRATAQRKLHADAVLPMQQNEKERTNVALSANPLRRYYVFDDGRAQILEAEAIRFVIPTPD